MTLDIRQPWTNQLQGSSGHELVSVPARRLSTAKFAYTTRHLAEQVASQPEGYLLETDPGSRPGPGDVVLAEVTRLGQHPRLESPESRRAQMYVGDEIVVAYGHRYAPDQFEAVVPQSLEPAHLVAAGGVVGLVTAAMQGMDQPTHVRPLGFLHDGQQRVSLATVAPHTPRSPMDLVGLRALSDRPPVLAVVGTSMNSGKSTALASLAKGLTQAGIRVAAGKATGTGAGGDPGMYRDGGAGPVLDFTDFGHASTYRLVHDDVVAVFASLVGELSTSQCDAVLVEIADGLFQTETANLLADPIFTELVDHVVFAAGESLSAVAAQAYLRQNNLPVVAVTGRLTSSPLALREADAALDVPVLDTRLLLDPQVALGLMPALKRAA